jgi:hypothetical protein
MKTSKGFHSVLWLSALLLGALACGGGGDGGGESFIVSGVWSISPTGPGTPNPSDSSLAGRACTAGATEAGSFSGSQVNVVRQDGTVTANELGSPLEFTGTVDTGNQSFTLNSTTPICVSRGPCTLCGGVGLDFFNAAGNTADVNFAVGFDGNAACPIHCVVTFPTTQATRS